MQLKTVIFLGVLGLCLAACATARDDAPLPGGCGAMAYQGAVGRHLSVVKWPERLAVRIVEPGTVVTPAHMSTRMNIRVDARGVITGVDCG